MLYVAPRQTANGIKHIDVDVNAGSTWSMEIEQHPAPLQRQAEAVAPRSPCVEQRPRVLQGLELQRDNQSGGWAQRGTQGVAQTAPPIEARHTGDYRHIKKNKNSSHTCCIISP